MTTPAVETKSIGLPADSLMSWFLLPIAIGIAKTTPPRRGRQLTNPANVYD
jgi:hypothetical protein